LTLAFALRTMCLLFLFSGDHMARFDVRKWWPPLRKKHDESEAGRVKGGVAHTAFTAWVGLTTQGEAARLLGVSKQLVNSICCGRKLSLDVCDKWLRLANSQEPQA
jgi:hypothetical protein